MEKRDNLLPQHRRLGHSLLARTQGAHDKLRRAASTYCWIRSAMRAGRPDDLTTVKGTSGRWRVTNAAAFATACCPSGAM
jgi:hypothetical protein